MVLVYPIRIDNRNVNVIEVTRIKDDFPRRVIVRSRIHVDYLDITEGKEIVHQVFRCRAIEVLDLR